MFTTRWRIARLLGIPISLDLSWLLILALFTLTLGNQFHAEAHLGAAEAWALGLAAALAFFAMFFSALTYHLYPLFQQRGLDAPSIVFAIALIGPAQVGGRFLISLFAPKITARSLLPIGPS